MRTCSAGLGAAGPITSCGFSSEWTSQIACARKAASKAPARNCGRPKRSRVKNLVIRQDEVFYHERAGLRSSGEIGVELENSTRRRQEYGSQPGRGWERNAAT